MKITCPNCKRRFKVTMCRAITCKCGNEISGIDLFHGEPIYIADANIYWYSKNRDERRGKACTIALSQENVVFTDTVLNEIGRNSKVNVIKARKISKEVRETRTNRLKQPSEVDLSIVQTAIDNPCVVGIITYDKDFMNIATVGTIREHSIKNAPAFWIGDAKAFLEKQGIWKKNGGK